VVILIACLCAAAAAVGADAEALELFAPSTTPAAVLAAAGAVLRAG